MDPGTQFVFALCCLAFWMVVIGWAEERAKAQRGRLPHIGELPPTESGGDVGEDGDLRLRGGGLSGSITDLPAGGTLIEVWGLDPTLWLRTSRAGPLPQVATGDPLFDQRWQIESDLGVALPYLSHDVRRNLEALAREPGFESIKIGGGHLEAHLSPGFHGHQTAALLSRLEGVAASLEKTPGAKRRLLEMTRTDPDLAVKVTALIVLASGPPSQEREEALVEAGLSTSPEKALVAAIAKGDAATIASIFSAMDIERDRFSLPGIARLPLVGLDLSTRRRLGLTLLSAPLPELVCFGLHLLRESCEPGDEELGSALRSMRTPLTELVKIELALCLEKIGDRSTIPMLQAALRDLPLYGPARLRLTQAIEAIRTRHEEELEERRAETAGAIQLAPEASGGEIKVAHAESGAVKLAPREPEPSR